MKTWLITGCSSGIGKGIATAVLEAGDQAVITCRDITKLEEFYKYGDRVYPLSLEITDTDNIKDVVKKTKERYGQIDVLVNNAGRGFRNAIEEAEYEDILNLFETNLFGPVEMIKAVLPDMRNRHSGTIVNISSTGAVKVNAGSGYYSATKAGLESISEALEKEVSPLGIHVMIVEPGPFRTRFRVDSLSTNKSIGDYDSTSGVVAKNFKENPYSQNGDPLKAGKHIVEAVNLEQPPKVLILGNGMIEFVEKAYHERVEEVNKWSKYTNTSNYE